MLLLNDQHIDRFEFPGGELQVKLPDAIPGQRVVLTWKPTCSDHIMILLLTVNALRHQDIKDISLEVLYLPYARQDRVCSPGEAFSLEVIVNILDNLKLNRIYLYDVHNWKMTKKLFRKTEVMERYIYNRTPDFNNDNLKVCAPDAGSVYRAGDFADYFDLAEPIQLTKVRDPLTGHIECMSMTKDQEVKDFDIIIVDDICDGGYTFILAAKLLKHLGAKKLYLHVTHGIFSKGLNELLEHFEHIYCHHILHNCQYTSGDRLTILREFPHGI